MKGIEEWQSLDLQWLGLEDNTFSPHKKNFIQVQNLSWAMRTKTNDLRFSNHSPIKQISPYNPD